MVIAGRILEYGHTHFHSGKVYLNNDNLSCPTKTSLEEKCNKLLKELLSEILEESPDGVQQHIKWEVKEDPNTIKAEESTDVISKEVGAHDM